MIGHIAHVEGAPTPTVVLDATRLPGEEAQLRPVLTVAREWLAGNGQAHVLKMALVSPSDHPLFDLDYRFVQALPDALDSFDFRGSCGHSILASVVCAEERGWLPRLAPGGRVRVRVLNNGDHVVCEVDEARRRSGSFTVHFLQDAGVRMRDLLLTGRPTDQLLTDSGVYEASLVSMGNPYVFVDARELGITGEQELFGAGDEVYERLLRIREAAADLLHWPRSGAFPKVAALGAYEPGRLTVRAVSVPKWHPSVALTGTICLAAAAGVPGALPARLARQAGLNDSVVEIATASGGTAAKAFVTPASDGSGDGSDDVLQWVSVSRKLARLTSPADITPLRDYHYQEDSACLPLTV
ncbi:PrpF domain-containing protein [Streptomyces sp. NPDC002838]|uniref:PrpF domain-containing protein n=1 Tax=Streptomyces sp. NPDC002838 TaxID=3154436 RepID=UPI00331B3336